MFKKINIGISIGDLNGIGPEVVLKSLRDKNILREANIIVFASFFSIEKYKKLFSIELDINYIDTIDKIKEGINVIEIWKEDVDLNLGIPTKISGEYSFKSLEKSTDFLKEEIIDCLVTAPIDKDNISKNGFKFKGHTEYLEDKFLSKSMMLMIEDNLRIGLVTNHFPLKEISNIINKQLLQEKIDIFKRSLEYDFGIKNGKIALLGLNPHSGDNGIIGNEEIDIISPVIFENKNVFGPFPADGFFGSNNYKKYDGILAMYHDQAMLPFKILSKKGVNFTAGLTKIRTSPAHGTAYDIAKNNIADEKSFINAINEAIKIYKNRRNYK